MKTCVQLEIMKRCSCSSNDYPSDGVAFSSVPNNISSCNMEADGKHRVMGRVFY